MRRKRVTAEELRHYQEVVLATDRQLHVPERGFFLDSLMQRSRAHPFDCFLPYVVLGDWAAMTISDMIKLTLPEAQDLAQQLANENEHCHIICDRRAAGKGHVVLDSRKASQEQLGDAIDYAYPQYGGRDEKRS